MPSFFLLLYVSYLMLRKLSSTGQTHTLVPRVLSVFAGIDVPIVYMSIRWWRTQHPAPVFGGGADSGIESSSEAAFWFNVLGWAMWGIFLMVFRYALERRRRRPSKIQHHGQLKNRWRWQSETRVDVRQQPWSAPPAVRLSFGIRCISGRILRMDRMAMDAHEERESGTARRSDHRQS